MSNDTGSWGFGYWAAFVLVCLGQLTWWLAFVRQAWRSTPGTGWAERLKTGGKRLRHNLNVTTLERAERLGMTLDEEQLRAFHMSIVEVTERELQTALTLGALGLTAWGVLFAFAANPGTLSVRAWSLELLFLGVLAIFSGVFFFRVPTSESTRMGRSMAFAVGYAGMLIALASLLEVVFADSWLNAVGYAVALIVVLRDWRSIRGQIKYTQVLFPSGVSSR